MTYVLIWIINPIPSIALGMILVSSCPAGHISNFLTHCRSGNTALSVSVSALSTRAGDRDDAAELHLLGQPEPGHAAT